MTACEAAGKLESQFGGEISGRREFRGEVAVCVSASALRNVASYCKSELGFDYLIDVASVDHFETDPRWEVVYELYSMATGTHLRLKVALPEDEAEVDTVSDLWPTADWHEREIFDMMGIRFAGHADLRRILMWDGYPYYPLRKDFPLEGKPSDVPDVAFTEAAPLAGGPFVTAPTDGNTQVREPRARHVEEVPPTSKFISEP